VVSPRSEYTRSAVVANLAAVYAEAGAQALVLSMGNLDWRRRPAGPPPVERDGGVEPHELVPLSTPSSVDGVSRLQFDQLLDTRGQVVTQGPGIIEAAREVADAVLIDAPALLTTHDAVALLPAVDVVLIVAQYSLTRADEARESGDLLRRFRAPILGIAYTNLPTRERRRAMQDDEPESPPGIVLEHPYDVPPRDPAPTAKLWL
jgi:hypothetical protein